MPIKKNYSPHSNRRRKVVETESRYSRLRFLLTGRNISQAKPFSFGHSPVFFPFIIYMNKCRQIPATSNKGENDDETPFSVIFEELKRVVLPVFRQRTWYEGVRI
jgi:hypothetical protein